MLSNIVSGAVMSAFLLLLIPPFVTQVTGSATRSGVVLAVVALSALTGPWFGRLAERYAWHRIIFVASLVGMSLAFLLLAVDTATDVYSPLASILLGASIAAKNTVGSAFLVGTGSERQAEARQLTVYNLLAVSGQVVGGALVAALHLAGADFRAQFLMAAAFTALGAVLTWFTTARVEQRLARAVEAAHPASAPGTPTPPDAARRSLASLLVSPFGALMASMLLGILGLTVVSSQLANFMPTVFGLDPAVTSGLVALSGVVGIPVVLVSGHWLARSGASPPWSWATVLRGAGLVVLAAAGLAAGGIGAAVIASIGYLVMMASGSLMRSPLPTAAAHLAPIGPAQANGYVGAAGALGGLVGSLLAGIVADIFGFETMLWCAAAAAVLAILALPVVRRGLRAAP